MEVPNSARAFVPPSKLHAYLLAEGHPVGGPKARLLRTLGFNASNADLLEQQLLATLRSGVIDGTVPTPHGMKYVIRGTLYGPVGREINVRTIWMVPPDDPRPRFVTAYPIRE